ncbi:MAG: helix-turn-helix transcriptional regulator [Bacteroidia bacterium]|jgi:transcriptional regulator with XRE-family HTH domain
MMENTNIKWSEFSDEALQAMIGQFIQQSRIRQNKSQQDVAVSAGINRSTLSQIENGRGGTLITLIQILRVLDQISFLKVFQVEEKASPLYLAKMEMKKRKRSRKTNDPKTYPLPDW